MVLLHGLTRNARDFEAVAPRLAASGRRVVAADVRGRGGSDRAADLASYTVPVYARDVGEMAAALGLSRAHLVGTSMGGLIAMALATSTAGAAWLGDVVLNDIGPVLEPAGLARILAHVGRDPGARDWAGAAAYLAEVNAAAFPRHGLAEWDRFARRVFREGPDGRPVLDYDPAITQALHAAAARSEPAPDLQPLFDALARGRRLLLLRGARSDLLSRGTAEAMRDRADNLDLVEVADVGHAPELSEPEAVAALDAFFASAD